MKMERYTVKPRLYVSAVSVCGYFISVFLMYKAISEYIVSEEIFNDSLGFILSLSLFTIVYSGFLYGKATFSKEGVVLRSIMIPLVTNFKIRETTLMLSWDDCQYFRESTFKEVTRFCLDYKISRVKNIKFWHPLIQMFPLFHSDVYKAIKVIEKNLPAGELDDDLLDELREDGKI